MGRQLNFIKSRSRYILYIIGFSFLFSSTILMLLTFFAAYTHPSKTVTIGINWLGESYLELFFILSVIPILCYLAFDIRKVILPRVKAGLL